ncbi:MAG: type IV secretion system protein [Steroidobacteraceae bacterium]
MGFFQTFWSWLNLTLSGYIGQNTARVSAALEPAIVTLATVYVMAWGYLHMTGRIEEPFSAGLKRIVVLAVVLGVALHLWLYNSVIVDSFYSAPAQLAAAVVGAGDPVTTIDAIWQQGGSLANALWLEGTLHMGGGITFYIVGATAYVLIGLLCVYAMFLIALSSIASAVLLAIGPLFVTMLLFDSTRRYFEAWIAQLATYALISVLTVLVGALMLHVVASYAEQTAARGPGLQVVDAFDTILIAVIVLMLLRQVMPIAASLAAGLALNSFGTLSRSLGAVLRPFGRGGRTAGTLVVRSLLAGEVRVAGQTAARDPGDPGVPTSRGMR